LKTLPSNVSNNYLLVGNRPRLFLNIENASKSWASTNDLSGYTNRISKGVSISERIDSIGGMSIVSNANVSILKLGESIKFYEEATIYPFSQGGILGAGMLNSINSTYTLSRNANYANSASYSSVGVGQSYYSTYRTTRAYFQYNLADYSISTCEDAFICLSLSNDSSVTDFDFKLYEGTWLIGSLGPTTFKKFDGWASSGEYVGTQLNLSFNSSEIENTVYLRLNKDGRDLIVSESGSILKLMLISENDRAYTSPTDNEFAIFNSILNSTPYLKLIYNTVLPDNQRSRIYLGFEDKSTGLPTDISSMLNVWSGVVDEWGFTEKELELKLRHDDFKYNEKLTTDLITIDNYPKCDKENIGKVKSIVIGDLTSIEHLKRLGSFLNETDTDNRYGNDDFVKGFIYDNTMTLAAVFSSHALKSAGFFWAIWESSIESFVLLCGDLTAVVGADGEYSISSGDASKFPYRMILDSTTNTTVQPMQAFVPFHQQDFNQGGSLISGENAVDSDYTNWSLLDRNNESAEYLSQYAQWGVSNKQEEDIAIIIETLAESGYVSDAIQISFYVYKDDGTALEQVDNYINTDGQHIYYYSDSDLSEEYINILIVVQAVKDISAKPCKFRNICIAKAYSKEVPNKVYMKCQGIADDDDGTYTGTANTLIENPISIMKWFAMVKGSLSSSNIHSSFSDAMDNLSDWKFAFQWSEDLGIDYIFPFGGKKSIIGELAKQCKSSVWWNNEGELKINVFDISTGFANSKSDVPDSLDIFELSGSPSSNILTKNPIFSYTMEMSSIDEVYNDFILRYGQNYATNEYNKIFYMTNGEGIVANVETNLTDYEADLENSQTLANLEYYTSHSYNNIHTTNTLEFEAWAIRDDATAAKLLQYFIEWYTKRRWKVSLITGLNGLAFEIGDFVNLRFFDIEYQFGTATMNCKKWKIIGIEPELSEAKIKLEVIESETY